MKHLGTDLVFRVSGLLIGRVERVRAGQVERVWRVMRGRAGQGGGSNWTCPALRAGQGGSQVRLPFLNIYHTIFPATSIVLVFLYNPEVVCFVFV